MRKISNKILFSPAAWVTAMTGRRPGSMRVSIALVFGMDACFIRSLFLLATIPWRINLWILLWSQCGPCSFAEFSAHIEIGRCFLKSLDTEKPFRIATWRHHIKVRKYVVRQNVCSRQQRWVEELVWCAPTDRPMDVQTSFNRDIYRARRIYCGPMSRS